MAVEWRDRGLVLSRRRHGESASVVAVLTAGHGRHAGLLRGLRSTRAIDLGARVDAVWRARLAEHLGHWRLEAMGPGPAVLLDDPTALAALVAACALLDAALPEREPFPELFLATEGLFDAIATGLPGWAGALVRWELGLLRTLGYGLDLERCAVTGAEAGLSHVSPRSGRAVCAAAAAPYADRLLPLPDFLRVPADSPSPMRQAPPPDQVLAGLALTGHFLESRVFAVAGRPIPPARATFVTRYGRAAAGAGASIAGP